MAKVPQISDAEWDVMKVVWDQQPVAAERVVLALSTSHKWNPRTIRTMLGRLVRKGALAFTPEGRRYVYRAKVARSACIKHESRSFLDRVFGGEAAPAVAHLVEHANLTPEEISQLRRILDQAQAQERTAQERNEHAISRA